MSQPRKVPPHSSSPTKSSLRRPSSIGGPPQPPTDPQTHPQDQLQPPLVRSLLPSPHFQDDPTIAAHQNSPPTRGAVFSDHVGIAGSENTLGDEDPEDEQQSLTQYTDEAGAHSSHDVPILPTSFQPFFTLVEDNVSTEHYHPTVHYIFEDDDSDVIAEAACRSLEVLDPSQREQLQTSEGGSRMHHQEEHDRDRDDDHEPPSRLPAPAPGVHEHYLILDVHPRVTPQQQQTSASQQATNPVMPSSSPSAPTPLIPFHVTSAHSLSAEWQVLQTKVAAAPTIGDDDDMDEGWMLRIEGRGNTPSGGAGEGTGPAAGEKEKENQKDRQQQATGKETMEEMIDRFQRRMDEIRQVLETGAADE